MSLLRKCGNRESFFIKIFELGSLQTVNHALVKCPDEIDLFANDCALLKRSVKKLKASHALLRCKIVSEENDGGYSYYEDKNTTADENLSCFYYTGDNAKRDMTLMINRERDMKINQSKAGQLWRFVVVKVRNSADYFVILTIHHGITDGRNIHNLMLQLFANVEEFHFNEAKEEATACSGLLPSVEDIYSKSYKKQAASEHVEFQPKLDFKQEPMLATIKASGEFHALKSNEKLDLSAHEQSHVQNLTHVFSTEQMTKFKAKCKANNVKVTACLNVMIASVLERFYDKCEQEKPAYLQGTVPVSMRQYEPFLRLESDYNRPTGFYVSNMFTWFKTPVNGAAFWQQAQQASQSFQTRMANNEHVNVLFEEGEFHGGGEEDLVFHYGVSNYGEVPASISKRKLIQIQEHFFTETLALDKAAFLFFAYFNSIEGNLCFSLNGCVKFVSLEMMDFVFESFKRLFNNLII